MIRVVHPGSRIRMLTFSHPGPRIQGSKKHPIPDPGSGSATLLLFPVIIYLLFPVWVMYQKNLFLNYYYIQKILRKTCRDGKSMCFQATVQKTKIFTISLVKKNTYNNLTCYFFNSFCTSSRYHLRCFKSCKTVKEVMQQIHNCVKKKQSQVRMEYWIQKAQIRIPIATGSQSPFSLIQIQIQMPKFQQNCWKIILICHI